MEAEVSVIRIFSRDLAKEITIRQISKTIGKSYAFTNQLVWGLIKKGVLNKKEIGRSVICSINLKSSLSIALLVYNSQMEKHKEHDVSEFKDKNALTAFINKGRLIVVSENKLSMKSITKREFMDSIDKIGLDNTVIYGHEKYWEMVGDRYG